MIAALPYTCLAIVLAGLIVIGIVAVLAKAASEDLEPLNHTDEWEA